MRIYHVSEPVQDIEKKKKEVVDENAGKRLTIIKANVKTVKIWIEDNRISAV